MELSLKNTNIMEKKTAIVKSDNGTENNNVEYDDLLSAAGEFGLYQKLLFISTFPFYVFGVFSYFSQLFMTESSRDHWCWVPELANLSDVVRKSIAIPANKGTQYGVSKCSMYVADWNEVLSTGVFPNESWPTQSCQHGWEFNKSDIPYATITSDLGWVCEKDSYQATAQSIYFVGSSIGGLLIGLIADKYGRIPAAVASNLIGCVAGILSSFSRNFTEFAVSRFFMGMSYDNCMIMVYLLVLEYVAPKYRSLIANLPFAIFYTLAATALPWIALACADWVKLSLVTSIPMAAALLAPFLIPESPRWLLTKGRITEAVDKVLLISRINKKKIPSKLIDKFLQLNNNTSQNNNDNNNILMFLKRSPLQIMFICICLNYMCALIVFDALVRSLNQLNFNYFLSFTLVSFTEFPSLLIIAFILDHTGRKWLNITSMLISCIFSILTVFVGGGLSSVICAVIARFMVNMAVNSSMQWAAEMFPTGVRGSAASIVHICGYVATILSPFIVYMEIFAYWLPLVTVGCIAALGALVCIPLPETAGKDLPQTLEDGENMMQNKKFFDIPCLRKNLRN